MKIKLKDGIAALANAYCEINPGVIVDIPDRMYNPEIMDKIGASPKKEKPKKEEKPKPEPVKVEKSFRQELIDLPGVGPKIAEHIIAKIAKNKEGLANVKREELIKELRDDVVIVLDKYLGR